MKITNFIIIFAFFGAVEMAKLRKNCPRGSKCIKRYFLFYYFLQFTQYFTKKFDFFYRNFDYLPKLRFLTELSIF